MLKTQIKFTKKFFARQKSNKLGINTFLKNKPMILEEELSEFQFKVFTDETQCKVLAGEGGDGANTRIITRSITTGNYDGGNGGKGGDIIFKAQVNIDYNLSNFAHNEFIAAEGHNGRKNYSKGKDAKSLQISLPIGTQIYEIKYDTKKKVQKFLLKNLDKNNDSILVAKGGQGGLGSSDKNFHPLRQAGKKGQQKELELVLRIPNDIALIGMTLSGKSFLMSRLTRAISKISQFKNNTKNPIISKLRFLNNRTYTIADLPPMIYRQNQDYIDKWEFSKHLTFTKLILIVIDISSKFYFEEILAILRYLKKMEIENKQILFVLNKSDLLQENQIKPIEYKFVNLDFKFVFVSALEGKGIVQLLDKIKELLPEFKNNNQNFNYKNNAKIIIKQTAKFFKPEL